MKLIVNLLFMDTTQIAHFVPFTAFVQISIAFNFGLFYLERKHSMVKISEMFHEAFLHIIRLFTNEAMMQEKRYKDSKSKSKKEFSKEDFKIYKEVYDYRIELTTKMNQLLYSKFLQPLGIIFGCFGLLLVWNLCMLDHGEFYLNFILISGEITLVLGLFIFIRALCLQDTRPHTLSYSFIYLLLIGVCFYCIKNDAFFHVIVNTESILHAYFLLSYLPILLFVGFLIFHYLSRMPILFKLVSKTKELHKILDVKSKRNRKP